MKQLIKRINDSVRIFSELKEKIEEVDKFLYRDCEELLQKQNEILEIEDKDSEEVKEISEEIGRLQEEISKLSKAKDEMEETGERIRDIRKSFVEELEEKFYLIDSYTINDFQNEEEMNAIGGKVILTEQIDNFIELIKENFNMENIKKMSTFKLDEIIDMDMYNKIAIKAYERLKEKYKDDAELSEKIQEKMDEIKKEMKKEGKNEEDREGIPVLTNYKGSRQWTFRDEKGSLIKDLCCYEEIEDGSGKYEFFMLKEDEIEIRNGIMREYELTEEQANDIDIEAFLVLRSICRDDLAEKYILAFKDNSYDKGFDMCYNEKYTKRKERIKISKKDSKERDRIAKRHKKLGIAKIIGKSKIISRIAMAVGGVLLATGLIKAGVKGVHKLNEGQSVPKVESSMKDKRIGVLEGNGPLGRIKDTEKRLKQAQTEKNNTQTSENNFIANPFIQGNDVEFYDFSEQNQELDKDEVENKNNKDKDKKEQKVKKEHKENEETDKTNRKISLEGKENYGADKLALNEIITDMMKPYCKAKVGGKIYEEPTDALNEILGLKTHGKIQTKPESSKDRVYAKARLKYQSSDGNYICFDLENYEKDIKEGNMRKVILDVKKALKEKGLDSNYILNEGTQKVYLLEAPGISQWMKAEDTTMYEFEIDQFGNRIEKTADEKVADEKAKSKKASDEKVKNNNQNEAKKGKFVNNPFVQKENVESEDFIIQKQSDENISTDQNNKPKYQKVDFVKAENTQVVNGSAITVKRDIDDIMEDIQEGKKEAEEGWQLRKEAVQEQIEIEEEEER